MRTILAIDPGLSVTGLAWYTSGISDLGPMNRPPRWRLETVRSQGYTPPQFIVREIKKHLLHGIPEFPGGGVATVSSSAELCLLEAYVPQPWREHRGGRVNDMAHLVELISEECAKIALSCVLVNSQALRSAPSDAEMKALLKAEGLSSNQHNRAAARHVMAWLAKNPEWA